MVKNVVDPLHLVRPHSLHRCTQNTAAVCLAAKTSQPHSFWTVTREIIETASLGDYTHHPRDQEFTMNDRNSTSKRLVPLMYGETSTAGQHIFQGSRALG